jgi:hypothetical protein
MAALVTAAATAGIVIATVGRGFSSGGLAQARPVAVASSALLSRAPYLGVNCPVANSIACDRVGLAVWLKRSAMSVTATIAGAPVTLDHRGDLVYKGDRPHSAFTGFLQPAGIVSRLHVKPTLGNIVYKNHGHWRVAVRRQMWFGDAQSPLVPVRLTIHRSGGRTVTTSVKVALGTGWG